MKTILFDLDGTLLPMDEKAFIKGYFSLLAKKLAPYGYEPEQLVQVIWGSTVKMVQNDGTQLNEKVFWDAFQEVYGEKALEHFPIFESFYQNEFEQAKQFCPARENMQAYIDTLKDMGYQLVIATNPFFPRIAVDARIRWAGLNPDDFAYITTYENSSYCKPNPAYYKEILEKLELRPEECLMVGNNVEEDMIAKNVGIDVFLVPECLINDKNLPVEEYPQGGFDDLISYVKNK